MAAKKKKPTGYDLCVAELKKSPKIEYAKVKEKADKKKIALFPIVYGRAKLALGLVPTKPRGGKKKATRKATTTRRRSGPGRAKSNPAGGSKSDRIRKLLGSGMSGPEIAKKVGCSVNLVYVVKAKTDVRNTRGKRGPGRLRKTTATRGPGRPRKVAALGSLEDVLAGITELQGERDQLRKALGQINGVV